MEDKILGIGLIGCGNFCGAYLRTLGIKYKNVRFVCCSDLVTERAEKVAQDYNIRACTTEELLADPEVDIVLILTTPGSHYPLSMRALNAGKHVYCEKPMALNVEQANEIVALAESKGLYVGNAPDTFLDGGFQTCRKLIDEGAIGDIIGVTANFVGPGHELWHPHPDFYYQVGGGPILDMAPYFITALVSLVGPIEQMCCYGMKSFEERQIQDHVQKAEVLTNYCGIMKFRNGAIGNINMSFDIWKSTQPRLEIYGTEGVIFAPDPNTLEGDVLLLRAEHFKEELLKLPRFSIVKMLYSPEALKYFEKVDLVIPSPGNERGLGVSDMADAIVHGRKARAGADLSRHVSEALAAFNICSETCQPYVMQSTCEKPEPLY